MASTASYGLKVLITSFRSCTLSDCDCKDDMELMGQVVNRRLGPSHKLDEEAFEAICLDLDQHPISDRPATSGSDEKQRDDGDFDRLVEEAFKAFRDQERDILLNAPAGLEIGSREGLLRSHGSTGDKWWVGAAHMRHYLEILLVLKGIKPCTLFVKFSLDNVWIFSTVVIDCLVPIMDRLDLWSYGFRISMRAGQWVFYDARSSAMPLIDKIFLTHASVKCMDRIAYPEESFFGVPEQEIAVALGYPIAFNAPDAGQPVHIRDATEMEVLVSSGWPPPQCCVQGTVFDCPSREGAEFARANNLDFFKVLGYYYRCEQAARSVGTELQLFTGFHPEMTDYLVDNPGTLDGPAASLGRSGPSLIVVMEMFEGVSLDGLTLEGLGLEDGPEQQDESVEDPGHQN